MEAHGAPASVVKAQSAIEYLTTYGWAILILGIVIAAFFALGAFSPSITTVCTLPSQLSCISSIFAQNGNLLINLGQTVAPTISVTAVGCNTNQTVSNMVTNTPAVNVIYGGNNTIFTQCYANHTIVSSKLGSLFNGYVIINYTNLNSGVGHTAIGTIIEKVVVARVSR